MKNTYQALMVSHLAPAGRRAPGATQPERSAKNPPVRVICLLLLAGWLTCQSPAAAQSPTIIAGPANQVMAAGGTMTLGVTAGGASPAYQWFKDSRLLLGATNSTLTVANAGITNSGMYYVVVTNSSGMVISLPASVTVGNPSLLAWGANGSGQLGNGTTSSTNRSISVASNVVAGAAGANHSLFLKTDGTLWAMGQNNFGQLGNGTTRGTNLPISVANNVVAVAAGISHSLFVKTDGTLWAMGLNVSGQLGNGTTGSANLPISVANNVVAVAAGGQHSLFVKKDGTLWAMGNNSSGQLGNGTTRSTNLPISVASNVVAVAAGSSHSLFVTTDGTLWAMGANNYGQLGNGTTSSTNLPISVASNVAAVAAGNSHSLFIKTDGTLWAMGYNASGQLGNGTTSDTNLPVIVPILGVANIFPEDMANHSLTLANNFNATVILGNLGQFYTGGAISVTASTAPPGLTVNLTYNGSPFAPTNVGSYTVIGTVSDPLYAGSATNTLVIMPVGSITVGSDAALRAAMSLGGQFTLAFDGTLSLSNEITVTVDATLDASGHAVVLSGRGSNRLFRINAGRTLTLINLTLRDGLAAGTNGVLTSAGGDGAGGAILNQGGTLNAINCSFLSNTAQGGQGGPDGKGGKALGGAVFSQTGWVGLTNSTFQGNFAIGGPGGSDLGNGLGSQGGFSFGGAVYSDGGVVVGDNCSFQTNSSAAGNGASGYKINNPGGDASGGAIFNTNGSLELIRTVLSGNTSTGGYMGGRAAGGAIYHDTGTFEAVSSLFQMNSVNGGGGNAFSVSFFYVVDPPGDGRGGALWISVANCDIAACSFVSNSAAGGFNLVAGYEGGAAGGAIFNRQALMIENSTLYGDTVPNMSVSSAQKFGQAIYNDGGTGVLTHVTKVTLVPVSSPIQPPAGGITSAGNYITLRNCILASTNISWDCTGNLIDGGGNISSDGTPVFTQPTSHNNVNPQLGTLSYEGGPTPTVPLLPGSPAIDAACSQWCLATDQRGYPRPLGSGCDIGAVEAWPSNSIFGRISGYTTSSNGITVMSGAISALVQPDGTYGLTGLPSGASVVVPQFAGALFVPSNRVVNMPPAATGVDFYSYRSNALMISHSSNNALQILFAGQPGGTYRLLTSSNLQTWSPCATNTLTSDGLCQFVETNQMNLIRRIFRMVRP